MFKILHKLSHWLGRNHGKTKTYYKDGELYVCYKCNKCGKEDGHIYIGGLIDMFLSDIQKDEQTTK